MQQGFSNNQAADNSGFDLCYIENLCGGSESGAHFANYFGRLLNGMLRNRVRCPDLINDIRQETMARVLTCLRNGKLRSPGSLAPFVIGVCQRVISEYVRQQRRYCTVESADMDVVEHRQDPHLETLTRERHTWAMRVLALVPGRDREVLRLVYLDGASRSEVCRLLSIDSGSLRVALHRAKARARKAAEKPPRGSMAREAGRCSRAA